MYLEPHAEIDDLYENPHTLITIVKDGPLSVERAFELYSALIHTPAEHAVRALVEHPYLSEAPHRMIDAPFAGLSVQLVDVTEGLEEHLTHSLYDDGPDGIEVEPGTVIIACTLPRSVEDALYMWAHLHSVGIMMIDYTGSYSDLNLGPMRA